jgi:hypothetical protein
MSDLRIAHVVGPLDEPICPKCGQGHEDDGGTVSRHGSWNYGPFYWACNECIDDSSGYPEQLQWGHA